MIRSRLILDYQNTTWATLESKALKRKCLHLWFHDCQHKTRQNSLVLNTAANLFPTTEVGGQLYVFTLTKESDLKCVI